MTLALATPYGHKTHSPALVKLPRQNSQTVALCDTFRPSAQAGFISDDLLRAEAKLLYLGGAVALGVYAGYTPGFVPTLLSSAIAGAATATHGAQLGNAVAGGEAMGSGLVSHLTGIHLDPQVSAGLLGLTGGLLAYSSLKLD
ncbi:hypothetical protein IV102_20750 [bacterium]|nr:hypothetical protein [bacterium]